ncbi:MAG: ABC transporter permease [Bacilli bacterium]|nr:ABC transporter permease [Bacilli bacterium]
MKNKLSYLIKYSLNKKIKSKWFVIANVLLLILIVGLFNIDRIVSYFGGGFNKEVKIIVIDNTDFSYDIFKNNFASQVKQIEFLKEYNIEKSLSSKDDITKELAETKNILIVINSDEDNYIKAEVISDKAIDQLLSQTITSSLNNTKYTVALTLSGIPKEELLSIYSPIDINKVFLTKGETDLNSILEVVGPILILPVYFLVIFVVQMIGLEINEEKSTKGMEIIISHVSPKTHFFSKIIAANGFVLIQALLLFVYSLIGFISREFSGSLDSVSRTLGIEIGSVYEVLKTGGIIDKLVYLIPLIIILFLLTFLAYSLVAGILASITVNIEDYQQILGPIMIVLVAGFYLAMMASMFEGSVFIRVASYIPFISALLSPVLFFMGQISIIDVILSIIIMVIINYILLTQGLKIYKVGILNYSTNKIWTRLVQVVRNKDSI